MAINAPGIFLSQPTTVTTPSYDIACTTVSTESAITSREGSEKRIPGVPIEIPSLTPIVLKIKPTKLDDSMPFLISKERVFKCILHGFPS